MSVQSETLAAQHLVIQQVKRAEERGWWIFVDSNRVRVSPPKKLLKQFGFKDDASWIAGSSYEEALGFIAGFETRNDFKTD